MNLGNVVNKLFNKNKVVHKPNKKELRKQIVELDETIFGKYKELTANQKEIKKFSGQIKESLNQQEEQNNQMFANYSNTSRIAFTAQIPELQKTIKNASEKVSLLQKNQQITENYISIAEKQLRGLKTELIVLKQPTRIKQAMKYAATFGLGIGLASLIGSCRPEPDPIDQIDQKFTITTYTHLNAPEGKTLSPDTTLFAIGGGDTLAKQKIINGTTKFTIQPENQYQQVEIGFINDAGYTGRNKDIITLNSEKGTNKQASVEIDARTYNQQVIINFEGEDATNLTGTIQPGDYTFTSTKNSKNTTTKLTTTTTTIRFEFNHYNTTKFNEAEDTDITITANGPNIKPLTRTRTIPITNETTTTLPNINTTLQDYNHNFTVRITGNEKTVDLNKTGTNIIFEYINKEGTTQTIKGTASDPNITNFNSITYKEKTEGEVTLV